MSDGEQPLKEIAIALEGDAEVLRGCLFAASPVLFEPCARLREAGRELVDEIGHKPIGLLDTFSGIIDEACLDVGPA